MAAAGLFDALFCISQQRFVQKRAFETPARRKTKAWHFLRRRRQNRRKRSNTDRHGSTLKRKVSRSKAAGLAQKAMLRTENLPMIWEGRAARQRGAKEKRNFCSSASRNSFLSRPPPYPVSRPSAPITRWQGKTKAKGFQWFAEPTARAACGAPILSAICP